MHPGPGPGHLADGEAGRERGPTELLLHSGLPDVHPLPAPVHDLPQVRVRAVSRPDHDIRLAGSPDAGRPAQLLDRAEESPMSDPFSDHLIDFTPDSGPAGATDASTDP